VDDQTETSLASSAQDQPQGNNNAADVEMVATDHNQADKSGPEESNSDGVDASKVTPLSPATLALMCDEQDTIFMVAAPSPNGSVDPNGCRPNSQGQSEIYAEQERLVLTKFRDCLNRLISYAEIKGKNSVFHTHFIKSLSSLKLVKFVGLQNQSVYL
jgi:hypothetical protein